MNDLAAEKKIRSRNLFGNDAAISDDSQDPVPGNLHQRNFLSNERIGNAMLLEGGPREDIDTPARCKNKLDIKRIVPGHGTMGKPEAIDQLIAYLWRLLREVDQAIRLGLSTDAAVEAITLDKRFLVSRFSPASHVNPLVQNFHRLNILSTYQALSQERDPRSRSSIAA